MMSRKNLIIACTGSVASIKLLLIAEQFQATDFNVKVVVTESAKHFIDIAKLPNDIEILDDSAEWNAWKQRDDPILHIDLGKWADVLLIAPLSANSLAKISNGICDNLLTCIVRAWNLDKPLFFCPAMNTRMYEHVITCEQIAKLRSWGYIEIPSVSKKLMCGDTGIGAMADVETIVKTVIEKIK